MLVDRIGELQQQLGTLAGGRLAPLDECLLRGLDGAVDVLGGRTRDFGDGLARGGIQHLHGLPARRVDPLAADQVLML